MKIGTHKTLIRKCPNGDIAVLYHSTYVALLRTDRVTGARSVGLNSGGYRTATTKRRMNQCLEVWGFKSRVRQVKGQWIVEALTEDGRLLRIAFSDYMRVSV